MEGESVQPQILESQILQRFVINPCVVVKQTSKQPIILGSRHDYFCLCYHSNLSSLPSVAFVHPGLGTSTSQEAKEYFSDMQRHRIPFKYSGPEDDEAITLVRCFPCHIRFNLQVIFWLGVNSILIYSYLLFFFF